MMPLSLQSFKNVSALGRWLAQSVERPTPDLRVVSSSPVLGVEVIQINEA